MMTYQIKDIPGFPYYKVDTNGDIWGTRGRSGTGKGLYKLSPSIHKTGHKNMVLTLNKKRTNQLVHRLVATTFIANIEGKPCVCHIDGNPINNRPENLYWGTHKENRADSIRHGTAPLGEKAGKSKLTRWQVLRIRLLHEFKPQMTFVDIAKVYKVHPVSISAIVRRINWKHI